MAFQLSDDILDVASESDESGKTPGTDLREGVPTLPVLMAQRSTDPADARLLELLAGDLTDDALHAEALDLLRKHPAMDEARQYVLDRAREAQDLLDRAARGPGQGRARRVRGADRHPHRLIPAWGGQPRCSRSSSTARRTRSRGNGSTYGIFPVPLPEAYGASVASPSGQG